MFGKRWSLKWLSLAILTAALLIAALACNLPAVTPGAGDISAEQLRQTLAVQAGSALPGTLMPAQTTPTSASQAARLHPWPGLQTATPGAPGPAGPAGALTANSRTYFAQSGDTLQAVAAHFGVEAGQIGSPQPIDPQAYLSPGQELSISNSLVQPPYPAAVLPDSEVIYSPSAGEFDIQGFLEGTSGFLRTYSEVVDEDWLSGAEIVQRVAVESSVNPRFLLTFLEQRSGWVLGQPANPQSTGYPLGFHVPDISGLYQELVLAATQLNKGYYGWRSGSLSELQFPNEARARLSPDLNAGSVGVQYLFSKFYSPERWVEALYGAGGFLNLHREMFGDPWARAAATEPLIPAGLAQPPLELPFRPGEMWSLTGGPHSSWNNGSPGGALDFSPVLKAPPCAVSAAWATASAPGLVLRSANNVLALDLDGDGNEGSGWVLVYVHLAGQESAPAGAQVNLDDPLGHPSCERGQSTGAHVHIARKYNGEWLPADGPLPFVLSGWQARAGAKNYQGELAKGDQVVTANPGGTQASIIVR